MAYAEQRILKAKADLAAEREAHAKELLGKLMEQSILFNQKMDAERERSERLREAAQLKRNTIIHDSPDFDGEWVAVPREDFDALRVALRDTAEGGKP